VLTELMAHLGVQEWTVVGTGLGAVLAAAVAVEAGPRVAAVLVDAMPDAAALARLDPDLLAPSHAPRHSGAHVLDIWHQVRDGEIFAPWHAVDAAHLIGRSVPDPRTLHRRAADVLRAPGPWRDGIGAVLAADVAAVMARLPDRLVRVLDPTDLRGVLPATAAVDPDRLAAAVVPAPHPGGTSRRYLATGAGTVHVRLDGEPGAPPVLVLHPSPGSADTYRDVIADLATDFLVIGMDLIGNGYSDKSVLPEPEIADYAAVAIEALEVLAPGPVIVFGSHTGASVALEVAVRRPDLTAGLVVEGLAHFTGAEQVDVLNRYTPHHEPVHSGAHLVDQWHMLRDMHLFWPWFASATENLRGTAPDLDGLHNLFVQMIKTGVTYPLAYRAAFRHDPRPAVSGLTVPGLFAAHPADMLRDTTEALADDAASIEFAELAPAQGRGAAWALRTFAARG
jgi:pimeloyl-ACP methyl ester carboxylesterase